MIACIRCGFRTRIHCPTGDCPAIAERVSRSSLHCCLQRHNIARVREITDDKPAEKQFKSCSIGYFHIDIAEIQTTEGKLYMFVAIDRTSQFAYVELLPKAGKTAATQFLRNLIAILPYTIHTVLTDNGMPVTNQDRRKHALEHIFGRTCREHGIDRHLTKIKNSWTNGQVERMNRMIQDATVKRYH